MNGKGAAQPSHPSNLKSLNGIYFILITSALNREACTLKFWIPLDPVEFCPVQGVPNYTIPLLSNGMRLCKFCPMLNTLFTQPMGIGIVYTVPVVPIKNKFSGLSKEHSCCSLHIKYYCSLHRKYFIFKLIEPHHTGFQSVGICWV